MAVMWAASGLILANGDVARKWFLAAAWSAGAFPSLPFDHHLIRWALNIPATLFIAVFGFGPHTYYLFCAFVYTLAVILTWRLAQRLGGPVAGLLALAMMLGGVAIFPHVVQFMPDSLSLVFVVAGLYLYELSCNASQNRSSNSLLFLGAASALLFLAYGAKETNAFVVPGLVLLELFRRDLRRVIVFCSVFALLLLAETAAFYELSGGRLVLGRAQALISSPQLDFVQQQTFSWLDIVRRWGLDLDRQRNVPAKIIYVVFFALSLFFTVRRSDAIRRVSRGLEGLIAAGLSFAVLTSLFIVSIHPLRFGLGLDPRYLWTLYPIAAVTIAVSVARTVQLWIGEKPPPARSGRTNGTVMVCSFVILVGAYIALLAMNRVTEHAARRGIPQPYNPLEAPRYFAHFREKYLEGCVVLTDDMPSLFTLIAFSFRPTELVDPSATYRRVNTAPFNSTEAQFRFQGIESGSLPAELRMIAPRPVIVASWLQGPARKTCQNSYYFGQADRLQSLPAVPAGP
jgi:hypothetical protein